jgi:hypothetical protein
MQLASHDAVIERAAAAAGGEAQAHLAQLLDGHRDEDVVIVPVVGWRLRAAGLSHSCRPGSRFGELWAPSSKTRAERLWRAALAQHRRGAGGGAFVTLGRVCHLVGDAGVPARARGVWHFDGDPFESWLEANLAAVAASEVAPPRPTSGVAALVEQLAALAAREEVDTTRTPWGRRRYRRGRGVRVSEALAAEQAARLVPHIIGHTRELLAMFMREVGHAAG